VQTEVFGLNCIKSLKFQANSIKFHSISNPRTFSEFSFKLYHEFGKGTIRKVVPYLISYRPVFYLKFFESKKLYFGLFQIQVTWKIQFKSETILFSWAEPTSFSHRVGPRPGAPPYCPPARVPCSRRAPPVAATTRSCSLVGALSPTLHAAPSAWWPCHAARPWHGLTGHFSLGWILGPECRPSTVPFFSIPFPS
jgi:hypothetical protein